MPWNIEHVYFDIAIRTMLSYIMNETLGTIGERANSSRCRTSVAGILLHNCICSHKLVGIRVAYVSDFALAFPSIYLNWRGMHFAEFCEALWSTRDKINGWMVVLRELREDLIAKRNLWAKYAFGDATFCIIDRFSTYHDIQIYAWNFYGNDFGDKKNISQKKNRGFYLYFMYIFPSLINHSVLLIV